MSEDVSPWSNLGSNMLLPSKLRDEISQLRIMIRDLSIETSNALTGLRNELAAKISTVDGAVTSLRTSLDSVNDKAVYLEERISGIKVNVEQTAERVDEFNLYSFVDPVDVGIEVTEEELVPLEEIEGLELKYVEEGFVAPAPSEEGLLEVQPAGTEGVSARSEEEPSYWWDDMDEVAIADELVGLIGEHIENKGPVMNNQVAKKIYPDELTLTPAIKNNIKAILKSDDCPFSSYTVDKFRRLYYTHGEDGAEVYEKFNGGTTTS